MLIPGNLVGVQGHGRLSVRELKRRSMRCSGEVGNPLDTTKGKREFYDSHSF
jgi:hypothetical protein